MAKRKTISVADVVKQANRLLAATEEGEWASAYMTPEFRRGVIAMVEHALHSTETYNGFSYLPSELTTEDQPHVERTTYLRIGYDETRRRYH